MASDGTMFYVPQLQITQLQTSNMAIGKSNDIYPLDVQGDINVNGNICQNGTSIFNDPILIGTIMSWTSNAIPQNFLTCDGSAILRSSYSNLFNIIGTTYGSGDGLTTFNVPDLRGRVMVGTGSTTYTDSGISIEGSSVMYALGSNGGEEKHTMTMNEMPYHTHSMFNSGKHRHSIGGADSGSSYGAVLMTDRRSTNVGAWTNYEGSHSHIINSTGGSNACTLMQPYTVVQYIIKALPQYSSAGTTLNYWTQVGTSTYLTSTNIGIGTSNPNGLLHVNSISSLNALVVGSNGCVGIGTSNPTSSLTIVGNLTISGSLEGIISVPNISFSNLTSSNIITNTISNRYKIPIIGHEPPFLREIASSNSWEGITPITDQIISNFGWRGGDVNTDFTSHKTAVWENRNYMINFNTLTSTTTLPSSSANYFYTPITVDTTTHNQIFMSVINGDRWTSVNAFVLNSNLDPIYPLGVQTNTVNFANGSTSRLGPNNIQAIAQSHREWISWMLPNHVIAPNLVAGTSNVVRIGFCSGPNSSEAWISGIKCCPNPYANTYQGANDLYWASVSSMWGNGGFVIDNWNWNADVLSRVPVNETRIVNILVPQTTTTNSDLLIGLVLYNSTWYDWEGRIMLPYMGSMSSIIPSPIQIGRYGHGITGRSIYRHAYGFVLPYDVWSNPANIVTYQGAQALQLTIYNLLGHNAIYFRAVYSELVQPFYTS
jgi:microcystin-dependent protein